MTILAMIARVFPHRISSAKVHAADLGWCCAVVVSLMIVAMTAATPWLSYGPRLLIRLVFRTLCHQQPDRSFQIGGIPFAVCHRCFGIYSGIAAGLIGRSLVRRWKAVIEENAPAIVLGVVILVGLDWGLDIVGIWENTPLTRLATGFVAGCVGGIYLALALSRNPGQPDQRAITNRIE